MMTMTTHLDVGIAPGHMSIARRASKALTTEMPQVHRARLGLSGHGSQLRIRLLTRRASCGIVIQREVCVTIRNHSK